MDQPAVLISKSDYDKIVAILRRQEIQIVDLQRINNFFREVQLRQLSSTEQKAKRNLHKLLAEKSRQVDVYQNELKLAEQRINNCKQMVVRLGGSVEDIVLAEVADEQDDDSVDFEGEQLDIAGDDEDTVQPITSGISTDVFDQLVKRTEALQIDNQKLTSQCQV